MSYEPSIKAKINVNKTQLKYIVGNSKYTYEELIKVIKALLENVLANTLIDIENFINTKVPKDTGILREDLRKILHTSKIVGNILKIIIGTNVDYAAEVNEYSTMKVRHWDKDPQAEGNFYDKLLIFTNERVKINLLKAKQELEKNTILTSKQLSKVKVS